MPDNTKPKVLLVDDEPDILFSLKGLLRREFELFTATNAHDALAIMSEHPIEVVMTDQRMPDVTGVEMLGKVKTLFPDAIRIVFTGYADIKSVIDGINNGGLFRYITKPWDPDELIDVIREAATQHHQIVEQKQLLHDVRSYLTQTASNGGAASDSQRSELLARIEHCLEVHAAPH